MAGYAFQKYTFHEIYERSVRWRTQILTCNDYARDVYTYHYSNASNLVHKCDRGDLARGGCSNPQSDSSIENRQTPGCINQFQSTCISDCGQYGGRCSPLFGRKLTSMYRIDRCSCSSIIDTRRPRVCVAGNAPAIAATPVFTSFRSIFTRTMVSKRDVNRFPDPGSKPSV